MTIFKVDSRAQQIIIMQTKCYLTHLMIRKYGNREVIMKKATGSSICFTNDIATPAAPAFDSFC